LHRLDCLASHSDLTNHEFLRTAQVEMPPAVVAPAPLLTGHDLLALGMKPGPSLGALLREARELQLEEKLRSREEALAWAEARKTGGRCNH
jgi:poly(A) polymerase